MKFLIVDAFAEQTFGGNPAGVVLLPDGADYPSDDVMVKTAAELRYSETAFIKQLGEKDFQVRYFTPVSEIDLCGHATIGSFCALAHLGIIADGSTVTAHTMAGDLAIEVKGSNVMMEMSEAALVKKMDDPEAITELHRIMGLSEQTDLTVEGMQFSGKSCTLVPEIILTGTPDIIMPVATRADLAAIAPDMTALAALSERYGVTGVHAFTLDAEEGIVTHARNFAPLYGINEEAATGTSSGAMTYYLYRNEIIGDEADCLYIQGEAMGRPSAIRAELRVCADHAENPSGPDENPGGNGTVRCRIRVGGSAAILAEGEIYL